MVYRLVQQIIAIILFILFLPLMIVIGLLIKFDSSGLVIFTQIRLGKDLKKFRFYKFRTMRVDAKKCFPQLYRYHFTAKELTTLQFKIPADPRLTRLGRWLRMTSLDELPNLINVIRGEMNLVGPRPEIPEMLRYYQKKELVKFSVPPGITGYSQINGRGLLTFKQTIALDLQYIREKSWLIDIKVLLRTLMIIVRTSGAF